MGKEKGLHLGGLFDAYSVRSTSARKSPGNLERRWSSCPEDQAAADELKVIEPNAVIAVVKTAIARNTCDSLSAVAARELIQRKAKESMSKLGAVKPYVVKGPVTLELEFTTRNSLPPDAKNWPAAKVVDDRTVRYTGATVLEAWTRYRGCR